jgi:hypothetical protein
VVKNKNTRWIDRLITLHSVDEIRTTTGIR